ncbi:MAG TPA: hypothetical protein VK993_15555 [Chthoniobacterales bacterium]|nr:hypothetical protein [Chthoniobacterales bacterium]
MATPRLRGALVSAAVAADSTMVCSLTGKESKTCCCETQKDGKLLCKHTGKVLEKCCCTLKEPTT